MKSSIIKLKIIYKSNNTKVKFSQEEIGTRDVEMIRMKILMCQKWGKSTLYRTPPRKRIRDRVNTLRRDIEVSIPPDYSQILQLNTRKLVHQRVLTSKEEMLLNAPQNCQFLL